MRIDREHVLQVVRSLGTREQVERAERELGPEVDTEGDADLLRELGVDPGSMGQGGTLSPLPRRDDEIHRG
ncbi:hypothetical protein ACI797_26325 [Geodermatophilus sp. SYSU D00691]